MIEIYKPISVKGRLPDKPGKYLVKTSSKITGYPITHTNTFEARMFISDKGKKSWDVNNQVVTHWYEIWELQ